MKNLLVRGIVSLVGGFALLAGLGATPVALPTPDEIEGLVKNQQYRPALASIARILTLSPDRTPDADRYHLNMLKGECLIQLKETIVARAAFAAAADEAESPDKIGKAQALAQLCFRSPGGLYTPKPGADKARPKPLNILPESDRQEAFKALLVDELVTIDKPLKAALDSKGLVDVAKTIPLLLAVSAVEVAATGSDAKTGPMLTELKDHAKKLITSEFKRLEKRAGEISAAAHRWIEVTNDFGNRRWEKAGLGSPDIKELKDGMEVCQKIIPACQDLAHAFGKKSKNDFSDVPKECEKTYKDLERVLKADYSAERDRRP